MGNTSLIHTALLAALIVAFGLAATGRAPAADPRMPVIQVAASEADSQFIPLGIGKSVVRRARSTSIYFFDAEGRQITDLDIVVTRDLNELRAALKQALPRLNIRVEGLADGLVLTAMSPH
jgi:pilus assembly protein CpaC